MGLLSEQRRQRLKYNHVAITTSMKFKTTYLWDYLVEGNVVTPEQVECEEDQPDFKQARWLVRHLMGSADEHYDFWVRALKETGHGALYKKLYVPSHTDVVATDSSETEADDVADQLAKNLLRHYGRLELWSWHEELVSVEIDQIYTDLRWVRKMNFTTGEEGEPLGHYTEMFREVNALNPVRILMTGNPGTGKTTFVKRLVVDWSKLQLKRAGLQNISTSQATEKHLSNFKFVIPIFLRYILEDMSLEQIIIQQTWLNERGAKVVLGYMTQHPETVLLLYDGYDEFSESICPEVAGIVKRQDLQNVACITTCRTHAASDIDTHEGAIDSHVRVCGFSADATLEYIGKFFSRHPERKDGLTETINQSDDLKKYSRYPAVLLLMCILWRDSCTLADNLTDFYTDFVRYLCGRHEKKFKKTGKMTARSKLLLKYKEELLKIGKLALEGLKGDQLILNFTKEQVFQVAGEAILELGFLQMSKLKTGESVFSFYHKTLQEFLAAYFIVFSDQEKGMEHLLTFCSSSDKLEESKMIIAFVCGLSKDISDRVRENILRAIADWDDTSESKDRSRSKVLMSLLVENKEVTFPLPEVIDLDLSQYDLEQLLKFFRMEATAVKQLKVECSSPETLQCVTEIRTPQLDLLQVRSCKRMSKTIAMTGNQDIMLPVCKQLRVGGFSSRNTETLVNALWEILSCKSLESIDIEGEWIGNGTVEHLASFFHDLGHLKKLHMHKHECTDASSLFSMMESLKACAQLEVLDIHLCAASVDSHAFDFSNSINKLGETIPYFANLREMSVTKCRNTSPESTCNLLTNLQKNVASLTSLNLGGTSIAGETLVCLSELLSRFEILQELRLSHCFAGRSDSKKICLVFESLRGLPSLTLLDISENELSEDYAHLLAASLGQMENLRKLYLSNCRCPNDAASSHLIRSATESGKLEVLFMKGNKLGHESLQVLRDQIGSLQYLQWLNLSNCDLADTEAVVGILKCFASSTMLSNINLSQNHLGNQMGQLCRFAGKLGRVKTIDLRNNIIDSTTSKRVKRSAARMNIIVRVSA